MVTKNDTKIQKIKKRKAILQNIFQFDFANNHRFDVNSFLSSFHIAEGMVVGRGGMVVGRGRMVVSSWHSSSVQIKSPFSLHKQHIWVGEKPSSTIRCIMSSMLSTYDRQIFPTSGRNFSMASQY